MKQKFSPKWIASKQPRKQRKYRANAPLHIRHKMMSANLSKELRKKYSKRSFPVKKQDNVKIMRGEFKNRTGKIESVNLKRLRITIEGIYRTKKDGTKVGVYFNPSNLQIKELNLEDKKRRQALERKKAISDKSESKDISNKKLANAEKTKTKFKPLPKQEDKKQGEQENASKKK